jgi:hypothetical protein
MAPSAYTILFREYTKQHGPLVEPIQGWYSLHRTLWLAYSSVIKRGYYDVGTYANKPGDHSWGDRNDEPGQALAFDARRKGWLGRFGWGFRNAQKTAQWLWENHEALNINYVIVGRRVISRERPYWHDLTTGDTSHDWHLHVSGIS